MRMNKKWFARLAIVIALVFTLSFSIMPVIAGATDANDNELTKTDDTAKTDDANKGDVAEDVKEDLGAVDENIDAVAEGVDDAATEGMQEIEAIGSDLEDDAKGFDWSDWWWVLPLLALLALLAWWFLRKKPEPELKVVDDVIVEDEVEVEDRFVS